MADDDAPVGTDADASAQIKPKTGSSKEHHQGGYQSQVNLRSRLSRGGRRWVVGFVVALVLALWIRVDYRLSISSPVHNPSTIIFRIPKGAGLATVAHDLKASGVLVEPVWFRLLAWSSNASLKFGEYDIPAGLTVRGLLDLFVSGKTRQMALTVIEGWNFAQMRAALARQPDLIQLTSNQTMEQLMIQLGVPGLAPEGMFFPDTYKIDTRTTDLGILKLAYRQMQKLLDEEWKQRAPDLPYQTAYEALIMASIVEKETGRTEERPQIAGVFIRRLRLGMRLQTDPTVIYGMGERYKGDIRKDDLRRDTPYNTYTRNGLPPTPIALPGRASIHAALHPADGASLYFVARGDGGHIFSSTLEEHQRAVNQYQKH